jgi:hypothetical protein
VCFHTAVKYCARAALNNSTRRDVVYCGMCSRALFKIPFGPCALWFLIHRMASCTSAGLVNLGSLAGA